MSENNTIITIPRVLDPKGRCVYPVRVKRIKKLTLPILLVVLLFSCNREEPPGPLKEVVFEAEIDGYVDDSPVTDFSSGTLAVNGNGGIVPPLSKAILTFDLGNIPPGVVIISAILRLKCVEAPVFEETFSVRRIMQLW